MKPVQMVVPQPITMDAASVKAQEFSRNPHPYIGILDRIEGVQAPSAAPAAPVAVPPAASTPATPAASPVAQGPQKE